ncbi:2-oxoacid:acceptor oxidoreductase subunit alpha [Candidatus Peregrinibacteria bacterium]|jgi:2-oxoglutarate/2-oxoacid ferredoxin oxidoreductase subunit alpha|nr:2-oxoacid:acceptor oxidoreductase subunit alpha [Candidatus Peregrinibacteria bacterium]
MTQKSTINILIGGPAGSGIESAGMLLGKSLMRGGASVFACNEIMSLIRGGHNYNRVRFSYTEKVLCHDDRADVVVALDRESVEEHLDEIRDGGVLVYDQDHVDISKLKVPDGVRVLHVDLDEAAAGVGGAIYKNTVAIGVILGLCGLDLGNMEKILRDTFGEKGAEIVANNVNALKKGVEVSGGQHFEIAAGEAAAGAAEEMYLNGHDAFCLGAVKAGCRFVGEYPMTPSSSILHTMAKWAEKMGIVVKHAEDEIAAMNMIVGAGFAGARSLTGTSGGGFALMTEAVGMAGMSETPCVIVNAQRVGPSTGLPTKTEQGDLRQVMHASQGDYPRVVMAPGDPEECFEMGFEAFNYADRYQLPVLVLTDKYLAESMYSVPVFNEEGMKIDRGKILDEKGAAAVTAEGGEAGGGFFRRYALSEDGVSGRTLPGTPGGEHVATSYEHDEFSDLLEDADIRVAQMDKRMKKMTGLLSELPAPELIGEADADITLVSWGSYKPILEDVVARLAAREGGGVKANILMIKYMVPFHADVVGKILRAAKKPVLVEQNFSGQLGGLIKEKTGFDFEEAGGAKILKYDGRQMDCEYIITKLVS